MYVLRKCDTLASQSYTERMTENLAQAYMYMYVHVHTCLWADGQTQAKGKAVCPVVW